jgi:GTPase
MTPVSEQRSAFIALIGSPNAGKSTLLNQLIGSKIAIVSPKVQTTRTTMNGICMEGDAQLVFIDTPGIFIPGKPLEKAIVRAAWEGFKAADMVALIVDAKKGVCPNTQRIIESLIQKEVRAVLVLNKIDLIKPHMLLALVEKFHSYGIFNEIFMVSALTGDGVNELRKYWASKAPLTPWLYPEDSITDAPKRFITAEITREQLYMKLEEELPYSVSVQVEKWEERENGSVLIHQVIYVMKETQKMIIVGKGGAMIKAIGAKARKEMEEMLGQKVHLYLFVKVREKWTDEQFLGNYVG